MKKRAEPVMRMVFRRLMSRSDPSSPISKNPTETVIVKTSSPQMMTQRLLANRMGSGAANVRRLSIQECLGFKMVRTNEEKESLAKPDASPESRYGKKERGWTRSLV